MLRDDFCTAEKGFDPEGEFFGIKRFGNIVIHTGEEALLDVGGKGETIRAGKGCFQQHQINAAFFEGMERFFDIISKKGPVAGICKEKREPSF